MKRLALLLAFVPLCASADDGYVVYGGAPKLMRSHPQIRMVSERVVMTVGRDRTTVDCRFVFRNEGRAANVSMGFPDYVGDGEESSDPVLEEFQSWVDGKRASTSFVASANHQNWHRKAVHFAAGQTRVVRDTYEFAFSKGATSSDGYLNERVYVMHTGASWKGKIGRAELIVRFQKGVIRAPLRLYPSRFVAQGEPYTYQWWRTMPGGAVAWSGFAQPRAHGREIRFVRSNFEPGEADDIHVYYGFERREDSPDSKAERAAKARKG